MGAVPVAVVGNLNLDLRTTPIPASSAILEDGETSVAGISESVGGANTAAALATMGGTAHLVCAVGTTSSAGASRRFCADSA
jgi:sugar/nucleoside kinase (ribokinase family)